MFVLIWSMANAATSLVRVGYVQTAFSRAWRDNTTAFWKYLVDEQVRIVALVAGAMALAYSGGCSR